MGADIPVLHKPEELLAVLTTLLKEMEDGVHVVDERGYTVFYNRLAEKTDGLSSEEVLGRHVLEIFPSLTMETSTLLKVLQTKTPIYNRQQTFRNFKGHTVVTSNSTLPILLQGRLIGAVELARNITQVKELAERVVDLQAELYHRGKGVKDQPTGVARYTFDDLIGVSDKLIELKIKAGRAAAGVSTVLIYGETGTGKELLVQAIHNASPRRKGPFVAQNCAAIPDSLLEGILFGTVKGSFTGAENRAGLFELAHQGTLFLDEVNSMQPELQAKLLRVLQDGYIRRVGDSKLRPVDVRVMAAANLEPLEAVNQGKLRADLYYRLNVVALDIPPLRERIEDIPPLVEHFIARYNKQLGMEVTGVEPAVMDFFFNYDWPGNVRELEFALEGAMNIMEGSVIIEDFLPDRLRKSANPGQAQRGIGGMRDNGFGRETQAAGEAENTSLLQVNPEVLNLRAALERVERELISQAMTKAAGNVSKAAGLLGIPRQTLQYKLER